MQCDTILTDDEIAAALAAVRCYVGPAESKAAAAPPARHWHSAAIIEAQGLPPTRNSQHRAWGAAERAARAGRWSYGIIGI